MPKSAGQGKNPFGSSGILKPSRALFLKKIISLTSLRPEEEVQWGYFTIFDPFESEKKVKKNLFWRDMA